MPRRFPSPPRPGPAAVVVVVAAVSPRPMQSWVLCLGGGAGGPAARRVRLLLRQVLGSGAAAERSGRLEVRALHGSGKRPFVSGVARSGLPYSLPPPPPGLLLSRPTSRPRQPGPGMWAAPFSPQAGRPGGGPEAGYRLRGCRCVQFALSSLSLLMVVSVA